MVHGVVHEVLKHFEATVKSYFNKGSRNASPNKLLVGGGRKLVVGCLSFLRSFFSASAPRESSL